MTDDWNQVWIKLSSKIQNSSRYHQISFWNTAVGNSWKELKTLYCKKNANSEYLHLLEQASNVLGTIFDYLKQEAHMS